ncbi:MAG: TetR family transcriptional regulator C-terminal domain-containing protein [Paraglaciecola sp.]|uniref:TetR family transcriptional regulator C-terminal domain-containing protein n=1 Tax=Paraglaciecola sp. TaxID=1920173 RepID=UPI00273D2BDC|nr:TetR family transcriptional regulator C-terminal domain-containing protein [Paraglaciecola sp.]MDP5029303.1 TetR family transcriptional regulator C-terminal domain-containing protein [Paraglaciecola sp.]MDP5134083.1 TetR family transcriptional regulator C-terminal domain-containing protein [Paraglaciecola sp.]
MTKKIDKKDGAIRKDNYKKILLAAEKEFAKSGFKGTTIQSVGDCAGLPKTNVLYYFKTKNDLYMAVLRQILTLWNSSFDRATSDNDPAEALAAYITEKIEVSRIRPDLSKIFALEIINGGLNLDKKFRKSHFDWVEGRVKVIEQWVAMNKISVISPYHLLFTIWAGCQHYADFSAQIQQLTNKTMDKADFAEATKNLIHIVLKGCDLEVPLKYR